MFGVYLGKVIVKGSWVFYGMDSEVFDDESVCDVELIGKVVYVFFEDINDRIWLRVGLCLLILGEYEFVVDDLEIFEKVIGVENLVIVENELSFVVKVD